MLTPRRKQQIYEEEKYRQEVKQELHREKNELDPISASIILVVIIGLIIAAVVYNYKEKQEKKMYNAEHVAAADMACIRKTDETLEERGIIQYSAYSRHSELKYKGDKTYQVVRIIDFFDPKLNADRPLPDLEFDHSIRVSCNVHYVDFYDSYVDLFTVNIIEDRDPTARLQSELADFEAAGNQDEANLVKAKLDILYKIKDKYPTVKTMPPSIEGQVYVNN